MKLKQSFPSISRTACNFYQTLLEFPFTFTFHSIHRFIFLPFFDKLLKIDKYGWERIIPPRVNSDFDRTICHYSKLSLWSRRENEREREREVEKWRRSDYRWEYRMTLSSKNFRLANDQVRGGMKGNQLFQIGSGVTGIESLELLKMERAEVSLCIFFFSSPLSVSWWQISMKFHDDKAATIFESLAHDFQNFIIH